MPGRVFGTWHIATRGLQTADEGAHSSAVSAHPSGELHREPELTSASDQQKARARPTSATGLVIGSIVGTEVSAMPALLVGAGASSLLVLGVIAHGVVLLATMFGQLTRRIPNSDGGPDAYASRLRLHRVGAPPIRQAPARLGPGSLVTAAHPAANGKGSRCRSLAPDQQAAVSLTNHNGCPFKLTSRKIARPLADDMPWPSTPAPATGDLRPGPSSVPRGAPSCLPGRRGGQATVTRPEAPSGTGGALG